MSLLDLKKKCKEYHLNPCSGKGITKEVLQKKIEAHLGRSKSSYESLLLENDPELYSILQSYIHLLPDMRLEAKETLSKMKPEEQDPWRILYEELMALSREEEEARKERELFDAINEDNFLKINYYLDDEELLKRFFTIYPGLIFVLTKVKENTLLPLYVARGDISLVKKLTPKIISSIRDLETARKLSRKYSFNLKNSLEEEIREGRTGEALFNLSKAIPVVVDQYLLLAIQKGNLIVVNALLSFGDPKEDVIIDVFESAAQYGHNHIIEYLLSLDLHSDTRADMTVAGLSMAITYGQIPTIILLCDEQEWELDIFDHVIKSKNIHIVEIFLDYMTLSMEHYDEAINKAVLLGLKDILSLIQEKDKDVSLTDEISLEERNPILRKTVEKAYEINRGDILSILLSWDRYRDSIEDLFLYEKRVEEWNEKRRIYYELLEEDS